MSLGIVQFGKSGSHFIRAWDNDVWNNDKKDYSTIAKINSKDGDVLYMKFPTEEQREAIEKYALQFNESDMMIMLELEAEAVLVLQKQKKPNKGNTGKQAIYNKAIAELKYDSEKTFCQIIEGITKDPLSEDEKQEYIAMLVNDTENKIKFKSGNKILKNEYKSQPVFPPMMKVSEPKDLSIRGKVVSISKYSSNPKDEVRPVMKYVYHDKKYLVATDAFQLVVINVKEERENTFYDYSGAITFPRERFPKYRSVIPERIVNNNFLDLEQLLEQVKGVDKANSFFNNKTNELPAIKLLFNENGNIVFTNPKITLKALMSLWMTGVKQVDISVYPNNNIVFYDVDNDKTLAVVMGIAKESDTLFTPILGNGIN